MEFRRVLFRATTTLGVKVDEALRERLKIAAVKLGCTPHWLHKQALLAYVEAIERGQLPAEIAHFGQSDAQAEEGEAPAQDILPTVYEFAQDVKPPSVPRDRKSVGEGKGAEHRLGVSGRRSIIKQKKII